MKAIIRLDEIDQHGAGCDCGLCNANGKSYGASVYIIPDNITLVSEDDFDTFLLNAEANYRPYGPTEDRAYAVAEALCMNEELTIIKGVEGEMTDIQPKELIEAKAIIQDLLDDDINFDDHSVGIYGWGDKVKKEYIEGMKDCDLEVKDWSDEHVTFLVNGFDIRIALVVYNEGTEEAEARWEIIEEKEHSIAIVDKINFKIETDELLAYEFETTEAIYVEAAEDTFSLFRLNFYKEDESIVTYVANSEDYDVSELVSHLFDEEAFLTYFKMLDSEGLVPHDNTDEYERYYNENDSKLSGDFIQNINFKIDTDEMLAFEFTSSRDLYIKEGDYVADLFRIEFFKESKETFVSVAFSEDYDVSDEVTHLCDTAALLEYCMNKDKEETIEDNTAEFLEHCNKSKAAL